MKKQLRKLAKEWVVAASILIADASRHEFQEERSRVGQLSQAKTLRRCAKELRKALRRKAG